MPHRKRCLLKGAAAGLVGGFAATVAMNQFQKVWAKGEEAVRQQTQTEEPPQPQESEDATQKAAGKIAHLVTGQPLSREQKKKGGPLVHYAFGTLMGGLYGAAAEYWGGIHIGYGTGYGTSLFLIADEVGVPAFGLSAPSTQTPLPKHLQAWAAHLVYGATADTVRRLVRRWL